MRISFKKEIKKDNAITLLVALLFYGFFWLFDGPVMCVDSPSYIEMVLSREPFYPTFLMILRNIFGEVRYLFMAVMVQSILMAFAVTIFTDKIRNRFSLKLMLSLVPALIMFGVSLLCRFAAGRGSMYSNCILSEGIAIPLFILFFTYLYEYLEDGRRTDLIICAVLSVLLISTRKQMYLSLALLFFVMLYVCIHNDRNKFRAILMSIGTVIVVLVSVYVFDSLYHLKLNGESVTHFNDDRFLTTCVYYCAEREDSEYIKNDGYKALFEEIYDVCDAEGSMMHDAPDSMFGLAGHFAAHYDMIQIDHMWIMTEEYVSNELASGVSGKLTDGSGEESDEDILRETLTDSVMTSITSSLLPHILPRFFKLLLANYAQGMVNTAAKDGDHFIKIGLVIWAVYILLAVISRNTFGYLALLSSVLNILIVGSVIFCQTRYMIYNMPLFYTGIYLMILDIIPVKKKHR